MPALVLGVVLALVAFAPLGPELLRRAMESGGYYEHGPFVPFVVALLAWRDRDRLAATPVRPAPAGLVLVVGAAWLHHLALLDRSLVLGASALVLMVVALVVTLAGTAFTRALGPALAFLPFAIPVPPLVADALTAKLKLFMAAIAVRVLDGFGVPVVLEGNLLHLSSAVVAVEDACGGLKSAITLAAVAVGFLCFERTTWKRVLVLALALPVAIVANVSRLLVLCALASAGSAAAREGPLHEAVGASVYVIACLLLLGVRALPGGTTEEAPSPTLPRFAGEGAPRWLVATLLVLLGGCAVLTLLRRSESPDEPRVEAPVPRSVAAWTGRDAALPEELSGIPASGRRYESAAGVVDLWYAHTERDNRRIVVPECVLLGSKGFVAKESTVALLPTGPAMRRLLANGRDERLSFYWFEVAGRVTPDPLDVRAASVVRLAMGRRTPTTLWVVSTPIGADGAAAAQARVERFTREVLETPGPAR